METQSSTKRVQHTPGPWRARSRFLGWTIEGPPQAMVGQFKHAADAQLIIAAPDLLAAAKQAYEYAPFHRSDCSGVTEYEEGAIFEETKGCDCFIADLLAAIAKAEGRQP